MSIEEKVKIDKGIPMPGPCSGGLQGYPWAEMEVGDSFLHRATKPSNATAQASMAGNKYQRTFATRKTAEGYRIWRTA